MTLAGQGPPSWRERQGRLATRALALMLLSGCGGLGAAVRAGVGPTAGWAQAAAAAPAAETATPPGSGPRAGSGVKTGANAAISCQAAKTTLAMQECLGRQLLQADQELERYLERAQRRLSAERDLPAGALSRASADLAASQQSWHRSRDRYCQALWSFWSGGTIRGPMLLSCRIALARERQRRIWLDFLSFPDGSPPLLPEPPTGASD